MKEEAATDPLQITRKGINKDLEVINIDLLEAQAKAALPEGVYVFIANGNGDQWTLRENRRAFGDYVFTPRRMGAAWTSPRRWHSARTPSLSDALCGDRLHSAVLAASPE